MKNQRLLIKSILQTLRAGVEHAAILPGNFVAISPENKLTAIPWGSENLKRLIEQLLDIAELRLGPLEEVENAEIKQLRIELNTARQEIYALRDRFDRLREELENF